MKLSIGFVLILATFFFLPSNALSSASHSHHGNLGLENFTTEDLFKRLIKDNPTVVLLDDDISDLEMLIRNALESVDNAGSVVHIFNSWLRTNPPQSVKPRIGQTKTTPYRWTFICLIEAKRSRFQVEKYLEQLLTVGHGRVDRFILLSTDKLISPYLRSSIINKFRNLIGIATDRNVIYRRQHNTGSVGGQAKLLLTTELASISWITNKTINLNGNHFRISGTRFPPYMDFSYDPEGKVKLTGVNYRIFLQGSIRYNYTFSFNHPSNWKLTGQVLPNGSWDGVFGDVVYNRAEIASVSTQTEKRNGFLDFVGPFGRAHLIFVISHPETFIGKYAVFHSYQSDVWLYVFFFSVIFFSLFYITLKISVMRTHLGHRYGSVHILRLRRRYQRTPEPPFLLAFILLWSLSLEQTVKQKVTQGIRFLAILWIVFMMLMMTGFRGNLAASMSFPLPEYVPKTFTQLSHAPNYKILFDLSGMSAWSHFESSSNPMIKSLHRRSVQMEDTSKCVLKTFLDQKTTCIGWDYTLKIASYRNITIPQVETPLYTVPEPIWYAWFSFALSKNSIFTDAFQHIGQSCFEKGLLQYWRSSLFRQYRSEGIKWLESQQESYVHKKLTQIGQSAKNSQRALKIENFQFIFVILGIGMFVSGIGFVGELIRGKLMKQDKKKILKGYEQQKWKFQQVSLLARTRIHDGQVKKVVTVKFLP